MGRLGTRTLGWHDSVGTAVRRTFVSWLFTGSLLTAKRPHYKDRWVSAQHRTVRYNAWALGIGWVRRSHVRCAVSSLTARYGLDCGSLDQQHHHRVIRSGHITMDTDI